LYHVCHSRAIHEPKNVKMIWFGNFGGFMVSKHSDMNDRQSRHRGGVYGPEGEGQRVSGNSAAGVQQIIHAFYSFYRRPEETGTGWI